MGYLLLIVVFYIGYKLLRVGSQTKKPEEPRETDQHLWDAYDDTNGDYYGDYNEGFDDDDLR